MDSAQIKKVALLGIASIAIFFVIRSMGTPNQVETVQPVVQEIEKTRVLMAAENIPLGSRLSANNLIFETWPSENIRPGMIDADLRPDAIQELNGAIVRSEIFEGDPINEAKLVVGTDAGVMSALLAPGMRAVTTRISVETAAGGFIQPGDRVDVIVTETFDVQVDQSADTTAGSIIRDEINVSNILFENVQVLAIDQTFATDPEGEAYVIGSTATFELSPSDASLLQEAQASGEISLTLRGITASASPARSAARIARSDEPEASDNLVVYRSGEAQRVVIRGQ